MQIKILFLLSFLFAGCAYKVPVLRTKPASLDVAGVSRLGIVAIGEKNSDTPLLADFTQKVRDQFQRKGFFREVQIVKTVDPSKKPLAMDAVLFVHLGNSSISSDEGIETYAKEIKTGRVIQEVYYENGERRTRDVPEVVMQYYDIPYVIKTVDVRFTIDFKSYQKAAKSDSFVLKNGGSVKALGETQIRAMAGDAELLNVAAMPLVLELTQKLLPQTVAEKIPLASNSECYQGIQMAKQGDWNGALENWKKIVLNNSSNHAAYFNMGVAYESLKDYTGALTSYQKALSYSDRKPYRKAIERLQKVIVDEDRLKKQMKGKGRRL